MADDPDVRLERLTLDSGEHRFATDFHPRLTVIGGLDDVSRAALADEVIASLGGARSGCHLEVEHEGRSLTLFRPVGARHRVIDNDAMADVTDEFVADDGVIDLFAASGVDRDDGASTIRLTRGDLVERSASDAAIATLATVDQAELWEAAMAFRAADELVGRVSAGTGASTTDAMLLDSVEDRHAALVEVTRSYERTRLISLTIGYVGAMVAVALSKLEASATVWPTVAPFLGVTIFGLLLAVHFRRKVTIASAAEREALTMVNAGDYSSFHLERAGDMLGDDGERRSFMDAVTAHRAAQARWETLAGNVDLPFALEHQAVIRATSDLHGGMGTLSVLSADVPSVADDVIADLAQAIIGRIDAVRALGPSEESFPLIVDDPFAGLERQLKPLLLEMLAASATGVQIVVLTADPDVTEWARTESLAGTVSVVDPRLRPARSVASLPSSSPVR